MDTDGKEYENYVMKKIMPEYENVWHRENIPKKVLEDNKILMDYNIYKKYENNDIGFDLVAFKNNKYYFIQCKDHENSTLNINALAGFYFLLYEYNLEGIVFYNGKITQRIMDLSNNRVKYVYLPINKQSERLTINENTVYNTLEELGRNKFISIMSDSKYLLYKYINGIWTTITNIDNFITNNVYDHIKNKMIDKWEDQNIHKINYFNKIQNNKKFRLKMIKKYTEDNVNNNIKFDTNPYLLGFNNMLYDLENDCFREYKYDDYISVTTGYDWREPTSDEISTIYKLIEQIMPVKEERDLYLQILCTSLDGKCLEKFIIFNGNGGNGKGMMNDILLLALGNHAMIGNNSILFETNRTGSNPEKANIHKKRLVIFREPPEKNKFSNSIVKELTGGGKFSARSHHEKETEKELNLTMIIECNKKPLFAEEPTNAEVRRLIDIYFRSTFTTDTDLVDHDNNIYSANQLYKENEFQHKHKFALLKILFDEYKKYKRNNFIITLPKSVIERTQSYLELSCNLVQWFKDNYVFTGCKKDINKLKDIYDNLLGSYYFSNLSKFERKKYTKAYLVDYIENNIFFKKFYTKKSSNYRNIITQWKKRDITDKDINDDILE